MKMAKGLEPEPPDAGERSPHKVWTKCKNMYMMSHDKPLVLTMVQNELEDVFPDLAETIDRLEGSGVDPDRILRKIFFEETIDVSPTQMPAKDACPGLRNTSRGGGTERSRAYASYIDEVSCSRRGWCGEKRSRNACSAH